MLLLLDISLGRLVTSRQVKVEEEDVGEMRRTIRLPQGLQKEAVGVELLGSRRAPSPTHEQEPLAKGEEADLSEMVEVTTATSEVAFEEETTGGISEQLLVSIEEANYKNTIVLVIIAALLFVIVIILSVRLIYPTDRIGLKPLSSPLSPWSALACLPSGPKLPGPPAPKDSQASSDTSTDSLLDIKASQSVRSALVF